MNFLEAIAARVTGAADSIRPRPRPRFEPAGQAAPTSGNGVTESSEEEAPSRRPKRHAVAPPARPEPRSQEVENRIEIVAPAPRPPLPAAAPPRATSSALIAAAPRAPDVPVSDPASPAANASAPAPPPARDAAAPPVAAASHAVTAPTALRAAPVIATPTPQRHETRPDIEHAPAHEVPRAERRPAPAESPGAAGPLQPVRISIGKLEITVEQAAPARPRPARPQARPGVSLNEYLRRRSAKEGA